MNYVPLKTKQFWLVVRICLQSDNPDVKAAHRLVPSCQMWMRFLRRLLHVDDYLTLEAAQNTSECMYHIAQKCMRTDFPILENNSDTYCYILHVKVFEKIRWRPIFKISIWFWHCCWHLIFAVWSIKELSLDGPVKLKSFGVYVTCFVWRDIDVTSFVWRLAEIMFFLPM